MEHDHDAALFLLQGAHGASAVSQTQLAIDRGRCSGSRQLPEHERVHLLVGPALELDGDLLAGLTRSVNHMEAFRTRSSGGQHGFQLGIRRRDRRFLSGHRPGAFSHHNQP